MSSPVLSVVIPTLDRIPLLRQALQSVDALRSSGINLEIVLVDASADADATAALADEFGTRLLRREGAGAAASRNAGLQAARGQLLLFLDDDDVILPGHVRPHLERFRADPALGAVFGQVRLADFQLDEVGEPYPRPDEVGDAFAYLLRRPHQIGSFVLRTSVRETVGLLDESLPGSEDWDWELRVALRHEVAFAPEPCVLFRQRPMGSGDRLNLMRLRYVRRVFWRNVRRAGPRRPPPHVLAAMFAHHCGLTAGHFLIGCRQHAAAGDMGAVRFAFRGALASSPPHFAWALARERDLLGLLVRAHLPLRTLHVPVGEQVQRWNGNASGIATSATAYTVTTSTEPRPKKSRKHTAGSLARHVLPVGVYHNLRGRYWHLRTCWEEPAPLLRLTTDWRERFSVLQFIGARLRGHRDDVAVRLRGLTYTLDPAAGEFYPLIEILRDHAYTEVPGFAPEAGWTVVDVGANVGVFSLQAARAGARALACEPNPDCFRRLSRTICVNGLGDSIVAVNCAVGEAAGTGALHVGDFTVQGHVEVSGTSAVAGGVEVRILPLDELIREQGIQRVDLLKIDAEGFEVEVLRGAAGSLRTVQRVMLEYHSDDLAEESTALLRRHGLQVVHTVRDKGRPGLGELYARAE